MATQDDTKVYPGSIDRYRELRKMREFLANDEAREGGADPQAVLAATIAEELAGLAYILDGIRYSARAK